MSNGQNRRIVHIQTWVQFHRLHVLMLNIKFLNHEVEQIVSLDFNTCAFLLFFLKVL